MADERFVWRLDPQTQAFLRDIARANEATRRFGRSTNESIRRVEAGFHRARAAAIGFIGAFSVRAFLRETTDAVTGLQRIESAMTVATGSVEGGQAAFAFVREEADRLGLSLRTSSDGFAQLAAAARGTNLEGETTRELFLGAAEASTALGLSAEQTSGVIFALQQIISKGVVSAEEIRRQLGDRLPGAFQIAARSIGVTTSELNDMLSAGQLLSEDFLPEFARQLREEFGGQAAQNVDNLRQRLNRLETATFDFFNAVGRGGLSDAIGDLADSLAEAADGADSFAEDLGSNVGTILRAAGEAALFFGRNLDLLTAAAAAFIASRITTYVLNLVTAIRAAIVAAGGLGAALAANPIRTAALAIGGIVGVVTLLAQRMDDADESARAFRERLGEVRGALQDLGGDAGAAADELSRVIAELRSFSRLDALRALEGIGEDIEIAEGRLATLVQVFGSVSRVRDPVGFQQMQGDLVALTDELAAAQVEFENTGDISAYREEQARLGGEFTELTGSIIDGVEALQQYLNALQLLRSLQGERTIVQGFIEDPGVISTGDGDGDGDGGGGGGGGGRSSSRSSRDRFGEDVADIEAAIAAEERLRAAILESADAIERAETETDRLAEIRQIEAEYTGDQREELIRLTNELFKQAEATETLMEATEGYREAQELVEEILTESADQATLYAIALETLDELYRNGKITAEEYGDAVRRVGEEFGKSSEVGAEVGKAVGDAFRSIVQDINSAEEAAVRFLNRLAEIILQAAIFGPLEEALSGALSGGLGGLFGGGGGKPAFAGKKAAGGRVRAGSLYMVGENGPEPFIPTSDGIVLPNSAGGGSSSMQLNMPITLNAQGADREGLNALRREFAAFRRDMPGQAVAAVAREANRGGSLAKTLKVRK